MKIYSAVASDKGNLRENNEDNFFFNGILLSKNEREFSASYAAVNNDALQLYAVCDGMGGEELGEEASLIAVNLLGKYKEKLNSIKYHDLIKYIDMYFAEVNSTICDVRKANGDCRIGTTIALFVAENDSAHIINVGDSRIYRFSRGKLTQLTEDHTPAVRAFKMGVITKEEIKTHPHRNKLTQFLGLAPEELTIVPSRVTLKPKNNDRYLICSDGITDMLDDETIGKILSATKENPQAAVKKLVEKAKGNGGRDNITAIVLDVKKKKSIFGNWRRKKA